MSPARTILLLVAACAAHGGERFLVRAWQSEDGLPGNVVRSVVQSTDGWLWVATAEGVVRFDGVRFSGLEPEADAVLARVRPRALFAADDGAVWIATARGGLLRVYRGTVHTLLREAEENVPPGQIASVSQIAVATDGATLAVRGAELFHVTAGAPPSLIERTAPLEAHLRARAEDDALRGHFAAGADGPRLRDRKGRLWLCTSVGGLTVTEPGGATHAVPLSFLEPANRISELCEDREGAVWAATGENGLLQIRDARADMLTVADGLTDRTAFALLEDRSGAWWIASKSGGLDRLAGGAVVHYAVGDGGTNRPVSALHEDRTGTLWAATRNGSVFRFSDGEFRPAFAPSAAPSKVTAIVDDALGGIWFGGVQGLGRWADGVFTSVGEEHGYRGGEVTALSADDTGAVFAGTAAGMLWHGDAGNFTLLGEAAADRAVSALLADGAGLWVATHGAGLLRWEAGAFARFGAASGLPDLRLTSVLDDGTAYLWLGSLGGIFRVRKADLAASRAIHWLRIDRSDGLLSRECTGGFQPAAWRGRDGTLRFPTVNGVGILRPDRLALNPVPPPIVIEECRAGTARLDPAAPLRAGPGRMRLEFRFTALSFAAPEKVTFRTRLDGLDDEWRDNSTRRAAIYDAVPPGRYVFRVRAVNADGAADDVGASVAIEVRPHLWETAAFRTLLGVFGLFVAVAIGWAVARSRMKRRLAREAERSRIARDLHDDLGASLTEISMLAEVAAEEPGRDVHPAFAEIASKAHAAVGALDEIVWAVNPRHDTLASLADYLAAFAGEFLGAAGIALRLDVARPLPVVSLESEHRHSLFLAMREALNNVVRHAAAREVWLRVRIAAGRLEIVLEDDGRGFDPATVASGDGVANLHARLEALGGECRFTSLDGAGTKVHLSLPLPP